jgi:hypothetical protein
LGIVLDHLGHSLVAGHASVGLSVLQLRRGNRAIAPEA